MVDQEIRTYYSVSAIYEMDALNAIPNQVVRCFFCPYNLDPYTGGVILGGQDIHDESITLAVCSGCAAKLGYIAGQAAGDGRFKGHKAVEEDLLSRFWYGVAEGLSGLAERFYQQNAGELEKRKAAEVAARQLYEKLTISNQQIEQLKNPLPPDPQYCYLMRRPDGDHKIGISNDVDRRHDQIRRDFPGTSLIGWFECDDMRQAEKILHEQYAVKRKDGEWFDLDADEVAYLMSINKFASGEFWQRATPKSQTANQEKPF